eukprot:CAMPEP_0116104362 /NCGR_PEP_ID=MMETSP0327-20121206/14410_1 /TAXON_ID=44447 /ORGANISM="Pseudo-nitzschia delicatissima, Strain B596" /LENGTH=425 /DNA_ID=CAMNT_0003596599 /DNA_START=156 /DNA_END=1433 /DNA_ORIENTATION=-
MASNRLLLSLSSRTLRNNTINNINGISRRFSEVVRPTQPVTAAERIALRAARKERASKLLNLNASSEAKSRGFVGNKYFWYASFIVPSGILVWGLTDENSPPAQFADLIGLTGFLSTYIDDIAKPSHEKLLPDWSQMPNVPHDIPVPHTLVLDLENTLVSSSWDRKRGWRHAKRPGVDKFLLDMAQYYEIVLYSPSIDGIADPVVNELDKQGCIMHRIYRDGTYYHNGVHVKDLSKLNRNVNRMIVIDDDLDEVQFHPENVVKVKPYTDPNDRTDNTLARITPFLIEIARENHSDIPVLLSQYQGMDADEIADEQDRRVRYYRSMREEEMSRGIGGLAMMARKNVVMEPDMPAQEAGFRPGPQQLSAKDIVGAAPSSSQSNSGLIGFLNRREEEKIEAQQRKFEKWNEVMLRKQKEREEMAKQQA